MIPPMNRTCGCTAGCLDCRGVPLVSLIDTGALNVTGVANTRGASSNTPAPMPYRMGNRHERRRQAALARRA